MPDYPTLQKFPEDSANREYDVFEEYPECFNYLARLLVFGMETSSPSCENWPRKTGEQTLRA